MFERGIRAVLQIIWVEGKLFEVLSFMLSECARGRSQKTQLYFGNSFEDVAGKISWAPHVAHGKKLKGSYGIIGACTKQVAGLESSLSSRAGRLTLAQTVLGSIPIFQMQFERLPNWVHRELHKAVRSCVWAKHGGGRGMHLTRWETLTTPKSLGGANLKVAETMNWALLAKQAWRLMNCSRENLVEVLKAKYGYSADDSAFFKNKQRSSQKWKGITWGAELLRRGLRWKLKNVRRTAF